MSKASIVVMVIKSVSCLKFLLVMAFLAHNFSAENVQNECVETQCGPDGPPIRFPFRLKDRQPAHCGYLGFELSCTNTSNTSLHLPNIGLSFFVSRISYSYQYIALYNTDDHFSLRSQNFQYYLRFLNLSLFSPFQFPPFYYSDISSGSTLFNCSSGGEYYVFVDDSGFDVGFSYDYLMARNCREMFDVQSLPSEMFDRYGFDFELGWSKPNCGNCEASGQTCRLKKNSTEDETECFDNTPKLLPQNHDSGHQTPLKKAVIITCVTIGTLVLMLVAAAIFHVYNLEKEDRENQVRIKKFLEDYNALNPSRYAYTDIKKITNEFKEKLGEGAYGTVFKGKLSNEIFVAVKVLNDNLNGNGEEFINEVATMGQIHHVNVVRLVGYCAEGFRRALIYEFLPNNSLEKYISQVPSSSNPSLSWETRLDIALGIAKGIEYLHQGCDQRILHFDIKPHNVLLDTNFTPKISDFGLAKLCSKDQSAVSMNTARGTVGYIAPEVVSRNFGNVSYKSDVYSFGMLLLEMVGGRKNTSVTRENIDEVYYPEWIYNLLEEGEDLRILIEEEGNAKIAKKLATVGLWCIQWHPISRPTMKAVVQMLEGEEELTMPPNPFASIGSSKTKAKIAARRIAVELEAIAE